MSNTDRKGLILAAGFGSRLEGVSPVTEFKPLVPLNGKPLIFRTIDSLKKAGCAEVVIVLGHGHEEIRKAILESYKGELPLTFVYNADYELSNGVSVLAAKDELGEEFIMTMSDHVLGDSVMKTAKNYSLEKNTAALLVDYKIDSIFDMDDATKVLEKSGRIISIGKQISDFNCIDTGVFVCTKALINSMEKHYNDHGNVSISDGVQELATSERMYTVDIKDGFWQDVDTPEMLDYAEEALKS